jgi:hypothetical protein
VLAKTSILIATAFDVVGALAGELAVRSCRFAKDIPAQSCSATQIQSRPASMILSAKPIGLEKMSSWLPGICTRR